MGTTKFFDVIKSKGSSITLVYVPHGDKKIRSFRIHKATIYILAIVFIAFVASASFLAVRRPMIRPDEAEILLISQLNEEQLAKINAIDQQISELRERISRIKQTSSSLRVITDLGTVEIP